MVDHEEEDQQIDDLLYDFIKHIPQHEKKNVLKSLKLKFQRRFEFYIQGVPQNMTVGLLL